MTDRWNTPLGRPNGGYILAAMLRGLGEEIGASDPLVAAITYHSAPENGAAEITARPVRLGRRVQTGDATLVQNDKLVAQLTASFGSRTEGTRVQLGTPPQLDPPDQYADPRDHPVHAVGQGERHAPQGPHSIRPGSNQTRKADMRTSRLARHREAATLSPSQATSSVRA